MPIAAFRGSLINLAGSHDDLAAPQSAAPRCAALRGRSSPEQDAILSRAIASFGLAVKKQIVSFYPLKAERCLFSAEPPPPHPTPKKNMQK